MDLRHLLEAGALPWGLMMVPHRRKGDAEMDDLKGKILDLARPLMLPTFTAALAIVGMAAGPIDGMSTQINALQESIRSSREQIVVVATKLQSLETAVQSSALDRARQIESLEQRMRTCETRIAEKTAQIDSMSGNRK